MTRHAHKETPAHCHHDGERGVFFRASGFCLERSDTRKRYKECFTSQPVTSSTDFRSSTTEMTKSTTSSVSRS